MSGKKLFIRFTARAFRKLLSIYVFSYFLFGFEGRIWDLIVSVPDHCFLFCFTFNAPVNTSEQYKVSEKFYTSNSRYFDIPMRMGASFICSIWNKQISWREFWTLSTHLKTNWIVNVSYTLTIYSTFAFQYLPGDPKRC